MMIRKFGADQTKLPTYNTAIQQYNRMQATGYKVLKGTFDISLEV